MKTLVIGLLALIAIGCGGSNSGLGNGGGGSSPYAGKWAGTFKDQVPVNGQGTLAIDVAGSGDFTASGRNTKTGTDFTAAGKITDTGKLSGTLTSGSVTATLSGQLAIGPPSKLTGSVYATRGSSTQQLNIDLTK